jgi:hypothetical protein
MSCSLTIILFVLLAGCGIKTKLLQDGGTRVPINPKYFENKPKFTQELLSQVDTSVVYEEFSHTFYVKDQPVKVLARFNYQNKQKYYGIYRFYGNGCYNLFIVNRDDSILTKRTFDPNYHGYRGVYYWHNDKINGELVTQVQGIGTMGRVKQNFSFKGDTLIVSEKIKPIRIYIKRKILPEFIVHNANW